MTQAATLTISLALPLSAGAFPQPPWPPPLGISAQFTQAIVYPELVIAGPSTVTLQDFALLPAAGVQLLLVALDALDGAGLALTAPVRFNLSGPTSGTIWLPISGGQFAIAAPGTAGSVTGLQIVTTAPAVARVSAVG